MTSHAIRQPHGQHSCAPYGSLRVAKVLLYVNLLLVFFLCQFKEAAAVPPMTNTAQAVMGLSCDAERNRALVRFAEKPFEGDLYFPPLPPSIDGGLSALPIQDTNVCQFADGREVKVKHGAGEMDNCDGDDGDWFSLWVAKRKIVSRRTFFQCRTGVFLHSVVIMGGRVSVCTFADPMDDAFAWQLDENELMNQPVSCEDVDPALLAAPVDIEEYPPANVSRPKVGSIDIRFAQDAEFCRALVASNRRHPDDPDVYHFSDASLYAEDVIERQEWLSFRSLSAERPDFELLEVLKSGTQWLNHRTLDFDNDGREEQMIEVESTNRYFYGNFFIKAKADAPVSEIARVLNGIGSIDPAVVELRRLGWLVFEGGQIDYWTRYTRFHVARIRGTTYLLAVPFSPNYGWIAKLVKPTPDGDLQPICEFRRIDENY